MEIEVRRGNSPLVLGLPHTGTWLPEDVARDLNDRGRALADTDWHVDRLYADLVDDVTTVRTPVHRYVIDVNRDPTGISLYPGQNTTALCPETDFDGYPIYHEGGTPNAGAIADRTKRYHAPYHMALSEELNRVRAAHGFAVLYDCHSIRSNVPYLFDGTLPDFNIGTNNGATCAPSISALTAELCATAEGYTFVVNGRFKGGWTTRHYGRPDAGFHAIQMELAQSTYMDEAPPWTYRDEKANALRRHLRTLLDTLRDWRPT
ncbi:MAG: N-formylglutamate deformylase [Pseudomonadota bacterium]